MPRSVNGRIGILSQGYVYSESQFRSMAGDLFRDIARRAEEQVAPFDVQHYGVLVSFFHQRREGIGTLYKQRFARLLLAGAMNAREHKISSQKSIEYIQKFSKMIKGRLYMKDCGIYDGV